MAGDAGENPVVAPDDNGIKKSRTAVARNFWVVGQFESIGSEWPTIRAESAS